MPGVEAGLAEGVVAERVRDHHAAGVVVRADPALGGRLVVGRRVRDAVRVWCGEVDGEVDVGVAGVGGGRHGGGGLI